MLNAESHLAPPRAVLPCAVIFVVLCAAAVLLFLPVVDAQSLSTRPVTTERFEDYVRAHAHEHELIDRALAVARDSTNFRLEGMNDLRSQITTERGQYATRIAVETLREGMEGRLNKIEQAQSAAASASAVWAIVLGVFFTFVQVALRFLPMRFTTDKASHR